MERCANCGTTRGVIEVDDTPLCYDCLESGRLSPDEMNIIYAEEQASIDKMADEALNESLADVRDLDMDRYW